MDNHQANNKPSYYIGLMSGTSLDGIDAVIVEFPPDQPTKIHTKSRLHLPLPEALQREILALNTPNQIDELHRSSLLDRQLGEVFAHAVNTLIEQSGIDKSEIIAIGSHGQTLRHNPNLAQHAYTVQIGDPNTIAEITGITTVADFRRRDIAANGQGAPLVPPFHHFAFGADTKHRVVVNIGGMANISVIPKRECVIQGYDSVGYDFLGYDTGPGNCLMDAWIQQSEGKQFDKNGDWAKQGKINQALLNQLLKHPFFAETAPKSTGREAFNLAWVQEQIALINENGVNPIDIQTTLAELTAHTISDEILASIKANQIALENTEVFICGGGAHNQHLLNRLASLLNLAVKTTDALGVNPDDVEAIAFAWLAYKTINKEPSNSPAATGAKGPRILGGIYYA